MNLFRLIALALLVWIAWFMFRNYLARQRKQGAKPRKQLQGRMVKCRECDVHLPEGDALREGDDWYCSQAHRRAALGRS
jgi:uncharacterized protein